MGGLLGGGHKTARGERAYPTAPATRIRRPKKLGRSGESPVPQPWSIIAEPVKVGDEWFVLARHPSGQLVHVRRFKTQSEAKFWIARKSKAWLKKTGLRKKLPPKKTPEIYPLFKCDSATLSFYA